MSFASTLAVAKTVPNLSILRTTFRPWVRSPSGQTDGWNEMRILWLLGARETISAYIA